MSSKPRAFNKWPREFGVKFGPYRAVVDHVKDADTYLMIVDMGMGEYVPKTIRLLDYSSPEGDTALGQLATEFALKQMPRDRRARLYPEKDEFDPTFERWVARVELEPNIDMGTLLFTNGFARRGRFKG